MRRILPQGICPSVHFAAHYIFGLVKLDSDYSGAVVAYFSKYLRSSRAALSLWFFNCYERNVRKSFLKVTYAAHPCVHIDSYEQFKYADQILQMGIAQVKEFLENEWGKGGAVI